MSRLAQWIKLTLFQSRSAAVNELTTDVASAENGYETALWLLLALLDSRMHDGQKVADADRHLIDKRTLYRL